MTVNAKEFVVLDLKKVIERANLILESLAVLDDRIEYAMEVCQARVSGLDIVTRHESFTDDERLAWQMALCELNMRFGLTQQDADVKFDDSFNGGIK